MGNRRHEHIDEHNAIKHVCLLHTIQWLIMTRDHPAITFVNFFCEIYLLAENGSLYPPTHIVCRGNT